MKAIYSEWVKDHRERVLMDMFSNIIFLNDWNLDQEMVVSHPKRRSKFHNYTLQPEQHPPFVFGLKCLPDFDMSDTI